MRVYAAIVFNCHHIQQPGHAIFKALCAHTLHQSLVFFIGFLVKNTNAECASGTVYSVHPSHHLPLSDYIATTATTGRRVGAGLRIIGHVF